MHLFTDGGRTMGARSLGAWFAAGITALALACGDHNLGSFDGGGVDAAFEATNVARLSLRVRRGGHGAVQRDAREGTGHQRRVQPDGTDRGAQRDRARRDAHHGRVEHRSSRRRNGHTHIRHLDDLHTHGGDRRDGRRDRDLHGPDGHDARVREAHVCAERQLPAIADRDEPEPAHDGRRDRRRGR